LSTRTNLRFYLYRNCSELTSFSDKILNDAVHNKINQVYPYQITKYYLISLVLRFTPGKNAPGTHWIGGWVDPRAGLNDVQRKFVTLPGLKLRPPRSSSPYPVAIMTALSRLTAVVVVQCANNTQRLNDIEVSHKDGKKYVL
jgi:hypothetical protein